tara:strand:- start:3103 stop:3519 length:417 start_codon:yes stop_codon:yes gene_type:complete
MVSIMVLDRFQEDALQSARICVWNAVETWDKKGGASPKTHLITAAVFGILNCVRECNRPYRKGERLFEDVKDRCIIEYEYNFEYTSLLKEYLKDVEENGTFKGAHERLAIKHEQTRKNLTTRFRKESNCFIRKHKLHE